MSAVQFVSPDWLAARQVTRPGESRMGQDIFICQQTEDLAAFKHQGGQFVLLGVPEDIGPRANMGKKGADTGWEAFLCQFINLQSNDYFPVKSVALLGEVDCHSLMQQAVDLDNNDPVQLEQLRDLCVQLDDLVTAAIKPVVAAGLTPIVIGGGHNNAFPILRAVSEQLSTELNAVNLDPHSDFRPREGRHSGNGFSEAHALGFLRHYFVMGLDELKNSAQNLSDFSASGGQFVPMRKLMSEPENHLQFFAQVKAFLAQNQLPLGIEIDLDAINLVPASAFNYTGISHQFAMSYLANLGQLDQVKYLHLAEGAPCQSPFGEQQGAIHIGQLLSQMVITFVQAAHRS